MIEKFPLCDFGSKFPDQMSLFIGMVSFETRCMSIFSNLRPSAERTLLFKNVDAGVIAQRNLDQMLEMAIGGTTVVELDIGLPTATADIFVRNLTPLIPTSPHSSIFVDTTTFTHEQLLILLRVFEQLEPRCRIVMGYTGAEKYSTNTDIDHVWLTRGVAPIRSVLGYPGRLSPSRKLHLIVIVGFEHERVAAVIERFEPARLTLICGDPEKSVSSSHYEINKHFFQKVQAFVERTQATQIAVETCYISCVDPFEARDTLLECASLDTEYNVVVCPMNTKISTVGVAMASMQNERIQIAYAPAIEYNEEGYSSPSSTATVFEYPTVLSRNLFEAKEIKPPLGLSVAHGADTLPS